MGAEHSNPERSLSSSQPEESTTEEATASEAIRVEDLRKTFDGGEVIAVDDISFTVSSDEFVVIVGPSGCGKTTTLRCIAGLEDADSGTISLKGEDVTKVPPKDRELAVVFQTIALFPHMSVRKNISFGLDMTSDLSTEEKNERVEEGARMLGIEDLLDRSPRALSGGQRQRVSIGRALVSEPEAFLLDEPFSDLDANLRDELRTEVKKLQREVRKAMIFVTHDQEEAMTLGDKIIIMNGGKIAQIGKPAEIFNDPEDRFVADFIGSPSANFLECTIERSSNESRLVHDLFTTSIPEETATSAPLTEGQTVTLAIRPQWMTLTDADCRFDATVTLIEQIGARDVVYLDTGSKELIAVLGEGDVTAGDTVRVGFDMEDAWLFDPDGSRLL